MQNDVSVDCIWMCLLESNFSFLCYDYKTLLEFFTRASTTMSAAGMVKELQRYALYKSSEGY